MGFINTNKTKKLMIESSDVKEAITTANVPTTPTGKMGGVDFFDCDDDTYHKCRNGKKKYDRWDKYVGDTDFGIGLKQWAQKNPSSPILVRNTKYNTYSYLRN